MIKNITMAGIQSHFHQDCPVAWTTNPLIVGVSRKVLIREDIRFQKLLIQGG